MLMEFAEEKEKPRFCSASFSRRAAKACFTRVWQSSKFPRTAQTCTFLPGWVVICSCWISETPPAG